MHRPPLRATIRKAMPSEAPVLTELARAAKASWGYPPHWLEQWAPDLLITPEYIETQDVFVATLDGRIVGMTAIGVGGNGATLEHAWINPGFHGRGLGAALVRQALTAAASRGASTVHVVSDPFAEPFYLRLGATRRGGLPAPMPGCPDRVLPHLEFRLNGGPSPSINH
ncbi:MAG TPA: GNAT family N-acetyltransferase [Vicinamibacterales bacterium]